MRQGLGRTLGVSVVIIVGLIGRRGSGKSTAASILTRTWGARVISFAGPLRELGAACGYSHNEMTDTRAKEMPGGKWGISWRTFAQTVGVAARNVFGSTFWVDRWCGAVDTANGFIVVDDTRFVEEVEAIRSRGGLLIHIVGRPQAGAADTHISETSVDEISSHADVTITNDYGPGFERELLECVRQRLGVGVSDAA